MRLSPLCLRMSRSAPFITGRGYTNKCDLWSLGVIVWMLLAGYPPFHGEEKLMMSKIKAGEARFEALGAGAAALQRMA